jgi:hypothetical protein
MPVSSQPRVAVHACNCYETALCGWTTCEANACNALYAACMQLLEIGIVQLPHNPHKRGKTQGFHCDLVE